eukprot:COSAG05_NODE_999_length_6247_cov_26.499024_3_plen_209_part_00
MAADARRQQHELLTSLHTTFERCAEVYAEHGCFIVDDLVPSPRELDELEAAARRVWQRVRRMTPEQVSEHGVSQVAVRGLLSPVFGEPIFARHLSSDHVVRYATRFLGPQLRYWYSSLFTIEAEQQYSTSWHRDTSGILGTTHREDVSAERELAIIEASSERVDRAFKGTTCLTDAGDECLCHLPPRCMRLQPWPPHTLHPAYACACC